ncbi:MAG: LysE family translocator, partial [Pseudomonas sp.]
MLALFLLVAGTHFAALLSPGPDFVLLLRNALLKGRAQADGCAAGIALANLLSMLLVLVALQLLVGRQSGFWQVLQWLGGGYFIWLGVSALLARRQLVLPDAAAQAPGGVWWTGLWQGLLASSLNPKLPIFYAGLFGLLRDAAMPGWALALCVLWMTLVV